jgi:hypothetical protein
MQAKRISLGAIPDYLFADVSHPKIRTSVGLVFLIGVLLITSWFLYFAFSTLTIPYPIEYREGTAQVMNQLLLRGSNPFSLENQPLALNSYGIGYTLLVWRFAAVFGNTLFIERLITLIFLLLCLVLVAATIFRFQQDFRMALACGVLIMIGLTARGGLGAFPTTMGAFLFLAGILVPLNRSFDYPGLLLSALFSLLAFYTKPYFVLSMAIVASYLFIFISKKKGLLYSLFFILTSLLLYLAVRYIFKLYFIDTVISNLGEARRSVSHLYDQLRELALEFFPSLAIAFGLLLLGAARLNLGEVSFRGLRSRINILSPEKPLIFGRLNYFAYFLLCSAVVFTLVLGTYPGSWNYSYDILLPPFMLWLFQILRSKSRLTLIAMPLLLFNAVWLSQIYMNPLFLDQRDSKEWARLYQYVDNSRQILNSPLIVSEMIRLGMLPYDSGQTSAYYHIKPYPDNILLGPSYEVVQAQGQQYSRIINEKIKNQDFDRLILTEGDYSLYPYNLIERYYTKVTSLNLELPETFQRWTIDIWEPATQIQNTGP